MSIRPLSIIFITILILAFSSCHRKSDKEKSIISGIIPLHREGKSAKALEARYLTPIDCDTMLVYIDGERYHMTLSGEVFDKGGNNLFNLESQHPIGQLYYAQRGRDFFLFYSFAGLHESYCMAQRISLDTRATVWQTQIEGPIISCPIVQGQFAYISTVGHIGKLMLKNGQFDWHFNHLNKEGRYNRFSSIEIQNGNRVQFISPQPFSYLNDTITVNDITGEIIKMN